jgi:hypothetical protein
MKLQITITLDFQNASHAQAKEDEKRINEYFEAIGEMPDSQHAPYFFTPFLKGRHRRSAWPLYPCGWEYETRVVE